MQEECHLQKYYLIFKITIIKELQIKHEGYYSEHVSKSDTTERLPFNSSLIYLWEKNVNNENYHFGNRLKS